MGMCEKERDRGENNNQAKSKSIIQHNTQHGKDHIMQKRTDTKPGREPPKNPVTAEKNSPCNFVAYGYFT